MTREFYQQRRDDSRPSSRRSSSGYNQGNRPSRPPRPRVNRESVDRAWETGAPQRHADYRPRTNQGQHVRSDRFEKRGDYHRPQGERPARNEHPRRPPYDSHRDNYRTNNRRSDRSFDDNRRSNDFRAQDDHYNRRAPDAQAFHSDRRTSDNQAFNRDRRATNRRYPNERHNRSGEFDNRNAQRSPRNRYDDRQPRGPRQDDRYQQNGPRHFESGPSQRFEGDYERFNDKEAPRQPQQPYQQRPRGTQRPQAEDRHVTRLPDGRVLKGPRRVQRRNAAFWKDISAETDNVIEQRHIEPEASTSKNSAVQPEQAANVTDVPKAKAQRKPRETSASAKTRDKKAKAAKKSSSAILRPSQRGFKWPKHQANEE